MIRLRTPPNELPWNKGYPNNYTDKMVRRTLPNRAAKAGNKERSVASDTTGNTSDETGMNADSEASVFDTLQKQKQEQEQ